MTAGRLAPETARFGRFEILLAQRRLSVDGRPVPLGSRAFDLLAALVVRRDRVVPKEELIGEVWPGLVVEDNNLQVQISALRKVLGAQAIATVPGRGYRFTLAATANAQAADEAPPAPPIGRAGSGAQRRARLLVADDNKVNRLLLCRSLELMGHEAESADNGRAALQRLRDESFDLLLLDLEMPELDGFELLERRASDPRLSEVPVIVTSSVEGVASVARCIELGADDYLHKPVNAVLLKARVGSSLERKQLRDRQRELVARLAPELPEPTHPAALSGGSRIEATLLAARLADVGALALAQPAHETLELLGHWATLMIDAIEGQGGRVQALAGDTLLAVFGAPGLSTDDGGAPQAAVRAALETGELVALFNADRSASGQSPVGMSAGIASGEVVSGYVGTPRRAANVCVGDAVARALQLEALAAWRGDAVLIDEATRARLPDGVATEPLPPAVLPGQAQAVPLHALRRRG